MYTFEGSSAQSLIHYINLIDKPIIGVELGVYKAINICNLVKSCSNLKYMYGVDPWKTFVDGIVEGDSPDSADMELAYLLAKHNVKYSGVSDRIELIEGDSINVSHRFCEGELDLIFIDTHSQGSELLNELEHWYPKLSPGGLLSGHEIRDKEVQIAIDTFKANNNIESPTSIFDNVWAWVKK
jgi:hypothetical protein